MSIKLQGNGLWESSRMMLPEHKMAIIKKDQELRKRSKVELDDQEIESINAALQQSLKQRVRVEIIMYHPFEELLIVGVVERVDHQLKQFKIEGEWFELSDIEGVERYE